MLSFKVSVDKTDAQKYIKEKNINTDISKMFVMCASDGEKIVGVGAASMDIKGAVLEEIAADDEILSYAMAKAVLNSLDLGGVRYVSIENERLYALAEKLKFTKTASDTYKLDLDGYFYGGC